MVTIAPFNNELKKEVIDLILSIQIDEFQVSVTINDQPDLMDIPNFYQKGNGNFWVALDRESVIGTLGLIDIGNGEVALRKMFVASEWRGKEKGVGAKLLDAALKWCKERSVKRILLGTTSKYHAAHRFYEKSGFDRIEVEKLPPYFPRMAVDTIFYTRVL